MLTTIVRGGPHAGCFMEKVPMLVINGVFTVGQRKTHALTGMLSSHMMHDPNAEQRIFENICCATEVLSDPALVPAQIDSAIGMMLRYSQPIYLEIAEDIFRSACAKPVGQLTIPARDLARDKTKDAIEATLDLIRKYKRPLMFAGAAIQRWGLTQSFETFLSDTGIQCLKIIPTSRDSFTKTTCKLI